MRSAIQISLAALLALLPCGCAQERRSAQDHPPKCHQKTVSEDQPAGAPASRLESVTWNPVKHELTWVVSSGETEGGADYKALKSENYLIALDDATMRFNGEMRRFSNEEASNVHLLMDLVAKYAIDSTAWWDDGHGEPGKSQEETQDPGDDRTAFLRVSARPRSVPIR